MEQKRGYALLRMPPLLLNQYEANLFAQKNLQTLHELRSAVPFVQPSHYRGICREPLSPLPSLKAEILKAFEETGGDMHSNQRARWRFREIIGEDNPGEGYDEDMLPNLSVTQEVYLLLDNPDEYEIVVKARELLETDIRSLGFDIGYWGGDHFSLICDSITMPRWHPPDPTDFNELAENLEGVNEHVLFQTWAEAEKFRSYYMTKRWAETETVPGVFYIIQIGLPIV